MACFVDVYKWTNVGRIDCVKMLVPCSITSSIL